MDLWLLGGGEGQGAADLHRGDAVLQSHRFNSSEDLEDTILRYLRLYTAISRSPSKGRTPIGALKDRHKRKPELFQKAAAQSRAM